VRAREPAAARTPAAVADPPRRKVAAASVVPLEMDPAQARVRAAEVRAGTAATAKAATELSAKAATAPLGRGATELAAKAAALPPAKAEPAMPDATAGLARMVPSAATRDEMAAAPALRATAVRAEASTLASPARRRPIATTRCSATARNSVYR